MPLEAISAIQEILAMVIAGGILALVAYSPVARAIGNRIMHGKVLPTGSPPDSERVEELSGEMAAMRQALYETQERLDFTERMLAQQKAVGALPPGTER